MNKLNQQGLGEGLWKKYFSNGKLRCKGRYKNGKRVGKWEYYYESGQLKMQAFYIDEWLEGEFLSFHDNGQLEEKSHYTKNCLNGEYKLWYSSGQLEMEGSYANGDIEIKVGEWKTYWENGKLKSREYYDRGWADRRYESYDWNNRYYLENGQPDIKRIEERNSIARLAGELSSM